MERPVARRRNSGTKLGDRRDVFSYLFHKTRLAHNDWTLQRKGNFPSVLLRRSWDHSQRMLGGPACRRYLNIVARSAALGQTRIFLPISCPMYCPVWESMG